MEVFGSTRPGSAVSEETSRGVRPTLPSRPRLASAFEEGRVEVVRSGSAAVPPIRRRPVVSPPWFSAPLSWAIGVPSPDRSSAGAARTPLLATLGRRPTWVPGVWMLKGPRHEVPLCVYRDRSVDRHRHFRDPDRPVVARGPVDA